MLVEQAAMKKLQFDLDSKFESHEQVMLDGQRLLQVIINLLSNSIKFSFPQAKIQVELMRHLDTIVCKVTDSGVGIPAENI